MRRLKPVLWAAGGLTLLLGPAAALGIDKSDNSEAPLLKSTAQTPPEASVAPSPNPDSSTVNSSNSTSISSSAQSSSSSQADSQASGSTAQNNSSTSASITVNGQTYTAPASGSVDKTIVTDNGQSVTHVSMSGNQSSQGGNASNSVNVNVSQRVNNGVP